MHTSPRASVDRAPALLVVLASITLVACAGAVGEPWPPLRAREVSPAASTAPASEGWVATVTGTPSRESEEPSATSSPFARPEAVRLLQAVLDVLQKERDEARAAKALVPYVHMSSLDATGTSLGAEMRAFSFPKAHEGAVRYDSPVRVVRVRPGGSTTLGRGSSAEQGTLEDYFIAKARALGEGAMPAPVTVFFPASGGPPRVVYLGNL